MKLTNMAAWAGFRLFIWLSSNHSWGFWFRLFHSVFKVSRALCSFADLSYSECRDLMAIQHLLVCVAILKCHEDSKKPSECFAYLFVSAVWVSYSPKDNRGNGLASFVYCVSETFTVLFFREVFVDYRFVWYFVTDASSTFEFGLSPSFADFRAVSACQRAAQSLTKLVSERWTQELLLARAQNEIRRLWQGY